MDEEFKIFLINQANMYLNGMSFREIAEEVGQSHVTVRDNITNKIKGVAPDVYELVQKQIENNSEKTVKAEDVKNRILAAYKLLVDENKTISEIALILGTTENVIYRDLTNRLCNLHELDPGTVTEIMLDKAKIVLQKHSLNNLINKCKHVDIHIIEKIFPSENKRYRFIGSCALTFGIRLEKLSEIFDIPMNELEKKLYMYFPQQYESLNRLFKHGMASQDTAEEEFRSYIDDLYVALKNQKDNVSRAIELLDFVSDKKAMEFKVRHQLQRIMSDEDILILLRYQLKHNYDVNTMSQIFDMERRTYTKRVRKLEEKYPKLVSQFDDLCAFYHQTFLRKYKEGR